VPKPIPDLIKEIIQKHRAEVKESVADPNDTSENPDLAKDPEKLNKVKPPKVPDEGDGEDEE
jgi:hypothetical protein